MVEMDIKIESGDLYDYNLRHAYNSAAGIMGSVLGALMILVGLGRSVWIFVVGGVVLLIYLPWTLFIRSKQQVLNNPAFKEPLHYVLDEQGITISQGEMTTTQSWEDMVKAVSTGRSIIVYTSRVNATIFPRKQMGDKTASVIECISTHMPPSKVKIRL
ncbi:MAG: YcxB family protein [Acetatifactor sp.]|nr:YcxB family protein [Acetatifactor sp.]